MTSRFIKFIQLPAGLRNPAAVIAGCRAGGVGVINGELETDSRRIAAEIATNDVRGLCAGLAERQAERQVTFVRASIQRKVRLASHTGCAR